MNGQQLKDWAQRQCYGARLAEDLAGIAAGRKVQVVGPDAQGFERADDAFVIAVDGAIAYCPDADILLTNAPLADRRAISLVGLLDYSGVAVYARYALVGLEEILCQLAPDDYWRSAYYYHRCEVKQDFSKCGYGEGLAEGAEAEHLAWFIGAAEVELVGLEPGVLEYVHPLPPPRPPDREPERDSEGKPIGNQEVERGGNRKSGSKGGKAGDAKDSQ